MDDDREHRPDEENDKNLSGGDNPEQSPKPKQPPEPYTGPQDKESIGRKRSDMPFLDHIEELRWRLIKIIATVVIFALASFAFAQYIFEFITMPLGEVKLHYTEVTGSFYAYLKISFFAGVFAAVPVVFYQLWCFIAPGLYDREKKAIIPMVAASTLLFLGGAAFCFFIVMPIALEFLIGYGVGIMVPIITVGSYISFAGLLLIAFGCAFQLPVLGYFLGKIGIVTSRTLGKGRAYAVVAILIVGAVISPPDVFTQLLLAGPLYLLYEITILIVYLTQKSS